ncbi:SIR2 family protein [Rhodopirellula baltica]
MKVKHPGTQFADGVHHRLENVGQLYRRGLGEKDYDGKVYPPAWKDPEEFLEVVSGWAINPGSVFAPYREKTGDGQWKQLLEASLRRLAAEVTCCYADESVFNGERGLAYQQWASGLRLGNDVIITFNYDTIVESLHVNGLLPLLNDPLAATEKKFERRIPLLKMHGSVNWKNANGKLVECPFEETINGDRQFDEFAMAIPGAGKLGFSQANQWLWECASQFIEGANTINFVGYRIPETDGLALNSICRAIRRRHEISKPNEMPTINIVLGPSPTPERTRAEGLMRLLCSEPAEVKRWSRKVHVHDMWAQDYFQKNGTLG